MFAVIWFARPHHFIFNNMNRLERYREIINSSSYCGWGLLSPVDRPVRSQSGQTPHILAIIFIFCDPGNDSPSSHLYTAARDICDASLLQIKAVRIWVGLCGLSPAFSKLDLSRCLNSSRSLNVKWAAIGYPICKNTFKKYTVPFCALMCEAYPDRVKVNTSCYKRVLFTRIDLDRSA